MNYRKKGCTTEKTSQDTRTEQRTRRREGYQRKKEEVEEGGLKKKHNVGP
jgi:hypothetical protein